MNFTQDGINPSRNYSGIAVVILLHVALIYALVNGLAQKVIDVIQQPVETQIIKEIPPPVVKKPEPPKIVKKTETPPPPKVVPPPTFVPKVEVKVAVAAPVIAVTNTPPPPAPPAPEPKPEPAPVHTAASTSARSGCSAPQYPADSQENGESGAVTLGLLIGVDGKVVDSKIEKSSGFKSLDRAAQKALVLCTFKPATTDGKPEQSWTKMQYVWKLAE